MYQDPDEPNNRAVNYSLVELLVEMLEIFGIWLWSIALIGIITWLLLRREAMLTSPLIWKQMAFISLGFGSAFALIFAAAVGLILVPESEIWDMLLFLSLNGVLLPLVFIAGSGIGVAYSVVRLRAQLNKEDRSLALTIAAAMILVSAMLIFAVLPSLLNL
jgi:hypothetical protein